MYAGLLAKCLTAPLGKLTNEYDAKSVFNDYGNYGNEYSAISIWNDYSEFGSPDAMYSAFNKYTTKPPMIIKGGEILGYLTVNNSLPEAISPYLLKSLQDEFWPRRGDQKAIQHNGLWKASRICQHPGIDWAQLIRYILRMVRKVIFYETEGGACPAAKFLRKLPAPARDAVFATVKDVQEAPQPRPDQFCKMVNTDGLWEIRGKCRGDIFRLLCFFDGTALVVAAHGFQKKTQKTPRHEIQTAEKRKKDYFRRKR